MMEMSRLRIPIVCVVIGEGGSGGALGIGVGDRVGMFEHSFTRSFLRKAALPFCSRRASRRRGLRSRLRLTAKELKKLDIVDEVIAEPLGGSHRDADAAMQSMEEYLGRQLREVKRVRIDTLLKRRYNRLRNVGNYFESAQAMKASRAQARRPRSASPRRIGTEVVTADQTGKPRGASAPVV